MISVAEKNGGGIERWRVELRLGNGGDIGRVEKREKR
jgi:hypothetical protein